MPSYLTGIKRRLPMTLISLAVLGAAWYLYKLDVVITASIGGVIIVSAFVPERFSNLCSGLGFLGVAGVLQFHYGFPAGAMLCAIVGLLELGLGVRDLTVGRRRAPGD